MDNFLCEIIQDNKILNISIGGAVDEDAKFPKVEFNNIKQINFNFSKLKLINSCGIREWVIWLRDIPSDITVVYCQCPRILVEQINMIDGLMPKNGFVESFFIPYYCEECDEISDLLCSKGKDYGGVDFEPKEFISCNKCENNAEIDIIESKYLKFLKKFG